MRRNKVNGVIANNIYIDADRMSDANIGNLTKETMMIHAWHDCLESPCTNDLTGGPDLTLTLPKSRRSYSVAWQYKKMSYQRYHKKPES